MRGKTAAKAEAEKLIKEGKVLDLDSAKKYQGQWKEHFANNNKLAVDLGMGSGLFLRNFILHEQKCGIKKNYIGVEIKGERIWKAYKKLAELFSGGNIVLLNVYVNKVNQVFGKGEIDEIYLIYPDPWPKDRHAKHRMTSQGFIKTYEKILAPDGCLYFKSDNKAMYKFTKEQFNSCGWKLLEESGDLLASKYDLKNIESDFEKVFKLSKKKFYYLKYARP